MIDIYNEMYTNIFPRKVMTVGVRLWEFSLYMDPIIQNYYAVHLSPIANIIFYMFI